MWLTPPALEDRLLHPFEPAPQRLEPLVVGDHVQLATADRVEDQLGHGVGRQVAADELHGGYGGDAGLVAQRGRATALRLTDASLDPHGAQQPHPDAVRLWVLLEHL